MQTDNRTAVAATWPRQNTMQMTELATFGHAIALACASQHRPEKRPASPAMAAAANKRVRHAMSVEEEEENAGTVDASCPHHPT